MQALLADWTFHVPNYILAALQYSLAGRLLLGLFFDDRSTNYIWRAFRVLTDPILKAVGFITPRVVVPPVRIAFAFIWLMAARVALYVVAAPRLPVPPAA